jgi:hypothetical protein
MRLPKTKKTAAKIRAEHGDIIYGMAKGPWAEEWARNEEERGRSFSQQNIYDLCPEPPKVALDWAHEVAQTILGSNLEFKPPSDPLTLEHLYEAARQDGFRGDKEEFGFRLGCQATGMGIAWDDNHTPSIEIVVPTIEFYV